MPRRKRPWRGASTYFLVGAFGNLVGSNAYSGASTYADATAPIYTDASTYADAAADTSIYTDAAADTSKWNDHHV